MPIYSPQASSSDLNIGLHGMRIPVMSSLGIGPRGHDISVESIEGDDGSYRLRFKDSVTGEVLNTTPNLASGSRLYVCNEVLTYTTPHATYSTSISNLADTQILSANDIGVDDIVMFNAEHVINGGVDVIGIGIVLSVSEDVVSFRSNIEIDANEAIVSKVDDWLESHPEATTTVEDGSITAQKLDPSLPSISITNNEIDIIMTEGGE